MLFVCIPLLLLFKSTYDDLEKVHLFHTTQYIAVIKTEEIMVQNLPKF